MIGIIPIHKMHGSISLAHLKRLIADVLNLEKFWNPLLLVIQQYKIETKDYNLRFIFRCLKASDFMNAAPATVNN